MDRSFVVELPPARRVELGFTSAGAIRFVPGLRGPDDRIALRMEGSDSAALVLVPFEICAANDRACGAIDRDWLADTRPGARAPSGAVLLGELRNGQDEVLGGPSPAGRLVLVREATEPARLHVELGPTIACGPSSSTAIAWPAEVRCGDGWVEGVEACDPGTAEASGCQACSIAAPQCSDDGALVVTACAGEPSRCIERAVDPAQAEAVDVEVRLLAIGRSSTTSPALEVAAPAGACRCRLTEAGEVCDAGCRFARPPCASLRLQPNSEFDDWRGCQLDAEGCSIPVSASDSRVTATREMELPPSRVLARGGLRPQAVLADLGPDGGVVAHSLVGRSVVAPDEGALVFRHASVITRMSREGRVLWERGFGGAAGHVRPAAVALGPLGTAVFVGTFPRSARPEVLQVIALDHEGRQAWVHALPYVGEARASIASDGTVAIALRRRSPRAGASVVTFDERGRVLARNELEPTAMLLAVRAERGGTADLVWAEPRPDATLTVARARIAPHEPVRRVASLRLPGVSPSDISATFEGEAAWIASGTGDAIELARMGPERVQERIDIAAIDRCGAPLVGRSDAGLLLGTSSCSDREHDGIVVFALDDEGRVVWRDRIGVDEGTAHLEGLSSTNDEAWLVVRVHGARQLAGHPTEPTGGLLWLAVGGG